MERMKAQSAVLLVHSLSQKSQGESSALAWDGSHPPSLLSRVGLGQDTRMPVPLQSNSVVRETCQHPTEELLQEENLDARQARAKINKNQSEQ